MEGKEVGSDLADGCGLTPDVIPEASPTGALDLFAGREKEPGNQTGSQESKQEVRRAEANNNAVPYLFIKCSDIQPGNGPSFPDMWRPHSPGPVWKCMDRSRAFV